MSSHLLSRGSRWLSVPMSIIFVVLVSCGNASQKAATHAPDPFAGTPARVGDVVTISATWAASVTHCALSSGENGEAPLGGQMYLVVTIAFTNLTSSAQTLYTVTHLLLRDTLHPTHDIVQHSAR